MPPPPVKFARQSTAAERAAALSLVANTLLVCVKLAAGVLSGSISVLAEGLQSTVDVVASALIVLTIRAAAAPPDRSHPYGHGKMENLASLGQLLLIIGTAAYLMSAAWQRWLHPAMPRLDAGITALGVAAVVDFFVSRHIRRVARETSSEALAAEAAHLRSDMLACVGVLAGLVLVWLTGEPRLDPLMAGAMMIWVVVSGARLLRETLRPLLDESLPPEEEARVRAVLEGDSRVLGYHRLRTRRSGPHRLMDVHILLDDQMSFLRSHATSEDVEAAIRAALPNVDVMVHAEPFDEETRHQREAHADDRRRWNE